MSRQSHNAEKGDGTHSVDFYGVVCHVDLFQVRTHDHGIFDIDSLACSVYAALGFSVHS